MNNFNTIAYLPLVDATTEVSSVTTARYVSAVGLMILLYDCALTMEDEVSRISLPCFFGTLFADDRRCDWCGRELSLFQSWLIT